MKQDHFRVHLTDRDGNPASGVSSGLGFTISWQNGPLVAGPDGREQNGAFVETVLDACLERLKFFQGTKFACPENESAIHHLEAALLWLELRENRRKMWGIEGTHEA